MQETYGHHHRPFLLLERNLLAIYRRSWGVDADGLDWRKALSDDNSRGNRKIQTDRQ
jgi:hypothetical protein